MRLSSAEAVRGMHAHVVHAFCSATKAVLLNGFRKRLYGFVFRRVKAHDSEVARE